MATLPEITTMQTVFTLSEAVEYIKLVYRDITKPKIKWVNAATGKPVIIGYTS